MEAPIDSSRDYESELTEQFDEVLGCKVSRPLEELYRRFACSLTPSTSSLYLRDVVSNVSIFASSDGQFVLLNHALGKILVQRNRISAVFQQPKRRRFVTINDDIVVHGEDKDEHKVFEVFSHTANGQKCQPRLLVDLSFFAAERVFVSYIEHEVRCLTDERSRYQLKQTSEYFSYIVEGSVEVRFEDDFKWLKVFTPWVTLSVANDPNGECDIKVTVSNESDNAHQFVYFDGKRVHASSN